MPYDERQDIVEQHIQDLQTLQVRNYLKKKKLLLFFFYRMIVHLLLNKHVDKFIK